MEMNGRELTKANEKIIIALDVASREKALSLVEQLPEVRWFKVGLELFTACGPSLLASIREQGRLIFLDLKLHDIPNTVAGAVRVAVRHGASMLTVHAAGGKEMLLQARQAADEEAARLNLTSPKIVAVTVLTSLNNQQLRELGWLDGVEVQVLRLASLAKDCGLAGSVCSPREISLLRKNLGENWLIITPGIRPAWAPAQDQQRILSPAEALSLGADFLVIGRPIIANESPREAFWRLLAELETRRYASDRKNRSQNEPEND